MESFLYFRQQTKKFLMNNEMILMPLVKFLVMMSILLLMNWHLGYRYMQMRWILVILVSLVSSILPWQGVTILSAFYLLGHVSALSLEGLAFLAVGMLVIGMLQYLFLPGCSVLIVLVPLAFYLKIPYLIPLLAGVYGSALAFIPVCSGVAVYYLMTVLEKNAAVLLDPGSKLLENCTLLANGLNDKRLYVALMAFGLVTLIVYGISRIHFDYSRTLAIGIGGVVMVLLYLLGGFGLGVEASYVQVLLGSVVSVLLAEVISVWLEILDYTHTEYLEYEDDDYVYYVKAVPKIQVTAGERRVQIIGSSEEDEDEDDFEDELEE